MKTDIHPKFFEDAVVRCACGEVWTMGSTVQEVVVETCGKCHPFWTGEQRIVDSERRVERFLRRYNMDADETLGTKNSEPASSQLAEGDDAANANESEPAQETDSDSEPAPAKAEDNSN